MKKSKWILPLCLVCFLLQLAAAVLFLIGVLRLDMLPGKYMTILVSVLVALLLWTGLLAFLPTRRPGKGSGRRIFACLLALLVAAACVFGYVPVHRIHDTMQTITQPEDPTQEGPTRQVFVLADDPAQSLEDAAAYVFGVVTGYDEENTRNAVASIDEQLGREIKTTAYASVHEMVDGLYSGACQAIILNGGYVSILEETEAYRDFSIKTRLLCNVPIPEQEPELPAIQEPDTPAQAPTEPSDQIQQTADTVEPFIMYISGSDTRSTTLRTGNSDVNILVVVNPQTKQVLLVNTPRDYYIPNPAGDGALDKLTHCGLYGIKYSIRALADLYGIEIDCYSQINFTGFETLVDAVGGVTVESPVTFTSESGVTIYKGENYLNGKEALVFARERYQMPGGDNGRGLNQMKVIKAIITKATTGTTIITNYAQILDSLEGMFVTSMEMSDISRLVKMQLSDMAQWNIQTYAVSGTYGQEITYSIPGLYASVTYQDPGSVAYGSELISKVMAGDILTAEDVKYPG